MIILSKPQAQYILNNTTLVDKLSLLQEEDIGLDCQDTKEFIKFEETERKELEFLQDLISALQNNIDDGFTK